MRCHPAPTRPGGYIGIWLTEGLRGEVQLASSREVNAVSAVLPVLQGHSTSVGVLAYLGDTAAVQVLSVKWPVGTPAAVISLGPRTRFTERVLPPTLVQNSPSPFLDCEAQLGGEASWPWGELTKGSACLQFDDCVHSLACAQGHPNAHAVCPQGSVNAGADGRCLVTCRDDRECVDAFGAGSLGACLPWGALRVCF